MTRNPHSTDAIDRPDAAPLSRRDLGKRLFLGASALAVLLAAGKQEQAQAAPATDTWKLGGNTGVSTDGTNFLGTLNVAPLVFKVTQTAGTAPTERMRITPTGNVGIGTASPAAKLHVKTSSSPAMRGETASTTVAAAGVLGMVNSTAAAQQSAGVRGINSGSGSSGNGVWGSHAGSGYGVWGTNGLDFWGGLATDRAGAYGKNSGGNEGFLGYSSAGVRGIGTSSNGVYGTSNSSVGVRGYSASLTGVYGSTYTTNNAEGGVSGYSYGLNTSGVIGQADNGTLAVGVLGKSSSGFAGYFIGKVHVQGTLSGGTGSSMIDHPLEPDAKYLSHSFVESPDMKNVYDGNVTTDAQGEATVELPAYFEALNRDFRYQLTVMGQFAQAIITDKIKENKFAIKTDKPNVEVSWQVTGIRQDAYANAHRIQVEQNKGASERGTYLHPTEHGRPEAAGVDYDRTQRMDRAHQPEHPEKAPSP